MSIAGAEGDASSRSPIEVRARPHEKIDVAARPELMRRIAETSGGIALDPSEAAKRIGELFEAHLSESQPERVRRYPAWDRWWVLVGILALWTTAWTVRRMSGLT
jgi:hypothetical protein